MKHENRYALGKWMKRWIYLWVILGMLALILTAFIPTMLKARAASGDWTTYMADNGRSGYNPNETVINPSTAPLLKLKWTHTTAGTISTQPVEANSLIYWGSWDAGNEHATSLSNYQWTLDALCRWRERPLLCIGRPHRENHLEYLVGFLTEPLHLELTSHLQWERVHRCILLWRLPAGPGAGSPAE